MSQLLSAVCCQMLVITCNEGVDLVWAHPLERIRRLGASSRLKDTQQAQETAPMALHAEVLNCHPYGRRAYLVDEGLNLVWTQALKHV